MKRLPPRPIRVSRPKSRPRKGRVYPPPGISARVYIYIDPSKVHLFRYFLEARDNLGIMSVVDRRRAALLLRFSPLQEREMREFLEDLRNVLPFDGPITLTARPDQENIVR